MRDSLTRVSTTDTSHNIDWDIPNVPTVSKKRENIRAAIKHDYTCPQELSRPYRARHFLAWAAKNYEGVFVMWSVVYMAINGYQKAPTSNSREVQSLRNSAGSIRKALKRWKMFLVSGADGSVRVTYDDTDAARTELARRAKNYRRSGQYLKEAFEIIDLSKIDDSKLRAWAMTSVRSIVKAIPGIEKKLLPPAPPVKSDD
jgi:hypothetical protein